MRLVLAGFGVVGQSFAQLLVTKERELLATYGLVPRIVTIIDSTGVASDPAGLDVARVVKLKRKEGRLGGSIPSSRTTKEVIQDSEADVLVEATPTNFKNGEPGLSHIRAALTARRHVITCNKGPLGVAYHALHELARHNGVAIRYSGAVGGGTPVLDFGRTCSIGDNIVEVQGILNGTCNFILTKMDEGLEYADALKLAQSEGYAERDPSLDVEGYDSAVKLVIIANHLGLSRATTRDVKIGGITTTTKTDIEAARRRNEGIRLVATAKRDELQVSTKSVRREDPMCVTGTFNAVRFDCKNAGPKVIIGKGAGGPETASSLLRDLIEIRSAMRAEAGP